MPTRETHVGETDHIDVLSDVAYPWSRATASTGWYPTERALDRREDPGVIRYLPHYRHHRGVRDLQRIQAALEAWAAVRAADGRPGVDWADLDLSWAINHALGALPPSNTVRGGALRPWVVYHADEFVDLVTADDQVQTPRKLEDSDCWTHFAAAREAADRVAVQATRDAAAAPDPERPDAPPTIVYRTPPETLTGPARDPVQRLDLCADLPSLNRRPGTVVLPPGDYFIDHPIHLYPGQTLRGTAATRLVFRGARAQIRLGRVPDGAQIWDIVPREVAGDTQNPGAVLGRTFASLAGLDKAALMTDDRPGEDDAISQHGEWRGRDFLRTNALLENLTLVDARPVDAGPRPLVDALNGSWFRFRHLRFEGAGRGVALRTGRYSVGDNNSDTSPYFARVQHCTFTGFDVGILMERTATHGVEGCRFTIGPGRIGIHAVDIAFMSIDGCLFQGERPDTSAAGIRLDGAPDPDWGEKTDENGHPISPPAGYYWVSYKAASSGQSEFSHNRFVDLSSPVEVASVQAPAGMYVSLFGSVVDAPDGVGARRPTLATVPGPLAGLHLVDGLMGLRGRLDRVVVNAHAATPDASPPRYHGPNLLRGRSLRPGDQVPSRLPEDATPHDWWYEVRPQAYLAQAPRPLDLSATDSGPAGNALDIPVRVLLPALSRARKTMSVVRIVRYVVPNAFRPWGAEHHPEIRRMATRALGERPFSLACWVRTNLPVSASGGVSLALLHSHFAEGTETVIGRTTRHNGVDQWALLTGAGVTNGDTQPLLINERGGEQSAICIALECAIPPFDPVIARPEPRYYVEFCTPFVSTAAYGSVPRRAWLDESGGRVAGCLEFVGGARPRPV